MEGSRGGEERGRRTERGEREGGWEGRGIMESNFKEGTRH